MSIFVLKSKGIEPMLVGNLGISEYEGIYEEVDECNVPKKYRMDKPRGAGEIKGGYLRSNTNGITSKKYFKKISEALNFEPIFKNEFELLENKEVRNDWNKILEVLEKTDDNSVYYLDFSLIEKDRYYLIAKRFLKESEIEVQEHKFKRYEESFRGMYSFHINIPFGTLDNQQVADLKETYDGNRIRVDLETLKNIVNKYNLTISTEKLMSVYYSKVRTNFYGKDFEVETCR